MTAAKKGLVLRWQAGLRADLKRKRPPNQHRILAVAIVLVGYANADGTKCNVSQRTIADETGQDLGHVNAALRWLIDNGWVTVVGRLEHGGHRRTLTFPGSVRAAITLDGSQRSGGDNSPSVAALSQRSGQRSGEDNEPPTSDLKGRRKEEASLRPARGGRTATKEPRPGTGTGPERNGPPPPEVLEMLDVVDRLVPGGVDAGNRDLQAEARRLIAGDWTPAALKVVLQAQRLPKEVDSPTGLALKRLRKLPDNVRDHVGLQLDIRRSMTAGDDEDDP